MIPESKSFNIIHENCLCSAELSIIYDTNIISDAIKRVPDSTEIWYYFNRLIVPMKVRNKKLSSQLLRQVAEWSDQEKFNIFLEINPYGNLNLKHLIQLYGKFGFKFLRQNLMTREHKNETT